MATNKPTIKALKDMAKWIDKLKGNSKLISKIKTSNKLLKKHLSAQSSQKGKWEKDRYVHKRTKVRRLDSKGRIKSEY